MPLEDLRDSISIYPMLQGVDDEMERLADALRDKFLPFVPKSDAPTVDDVALMLRAFGRDFDDMLGVLLGVTNGSIEQMKRIALAMRRSLTWAQFKQDDNALFQLAAFLHDPDSVREPYIPPSIKRKFRLPREWNLSLTNGDALDGAIINKLSPKLAALMGSALERAVGEHVSRAGFGYKKGKVYAVNNKEVDLAVPDASDPFLLIMVSCMLTTASSQDGRAGEQKRLYDLLRQHNEHPGRRGQPPVKFVNVVDGGGWLDRAGALRTMWEGCDYILASANLAQLQPIVKESAS